MSISIIVFALLLVAVPFALAWGAFARNHVTSAICIAFLGAYAESLLWWPWYLSKAYPFTSVVLLLLRPFESAAVLVNAAIAVPLISVPSLALGAAAGFLPAWALWRNKRPRVAAALWVLIVPVVAWAAAEMLVTAELRRSAAAQFPAGYCTVLSRHSVSSMIRQQTYEERGEHVILVADGADYFWSFRERRFVKRGHNNLGYRCNSAKL